MPDANQDMYSRREADLQFSNFAESLSRIEAGMISLSRKLDESMEQSKESAVDVAVCQEKIAALEKRDDRKSAWLYSVTAGLAASLVLTLLLHYLK